MAIVVIVVIIVLIYFFVIKGNGNGGGGNGDGDSGNKKKRETIETLPFITGIPIHSRIVRRRDAVDAVDQVAKLVRERIHLPQLPA